MKIALCLSGQPRYLHHGYQSLCQHFFEPNKHHEIDVFVHTWYDKDDVDQYFTSAQEGQTHMVGKMLPDSDVLLEKMYNPKAMICEPQKNFDKYTADLKARPEAKQNNLCSLYYSMYMANNLKRDEESRTNQKYDIVVRTRTDLWHQNPIECDQYVMSVDQCVYVPRTYLEDQERFMNPSRPMPDIFALSSSRNIDCFCGVYPNFRKLNGLIEPPYGENYLGQWLRVINGIEVLPMESFPILVQRMPWLQG